MAIVQVHVVEGVFSEKQKTAIMEKVTDAVVEIAGEAMRGLTWVRIQEVASGEWGVGGKPLTAADVKALRGDGA